MTTTEPRWCLDSDYCALALLAKGSVAGRYWNVQTGYCVAILVIPDLNQYINWIIGIFCWVCVPMQHAFFAKPQSIV